MVGSPRLQGPYPPSLPLDGLLHGGGEFLHRAAVIHPRQCVRETVVDGLRDLRPPVHIGDTFAQGTPLQIVFRSALLGLQGLYIAGVVEGGFANPQHVAEITVGLVVEFRRVPVHVKLDPLPFLSPLQVHLLGPRESFPARPPTGSPSCPRTASRPGCGSSACHDAPAAASAAAETPLSGTPRRWPIRSAHRSSSSPADTWQKSIRAGDLTAGPGPPITPPNASALVGSSALAPAHSLRSTRNNCRLAGTLSFPAASAAPATLLPLNPTWMRNGNQLWIRAYIHPSCGWYLYWYSTRQGLLRRTMI